MHPIRKLRTARGMTITELAILSGVPARALGAAEHGIAPLTTHQIALLQQALQVPIEPLPHPHVPRNTTHWRSFAAATIVVALLGLVGLFGGELIGPAEQPIPAHAAAQRTLPTQATLTVVPLRIASVALIAGQSTNAAFAPIATPTPSPVADRMPHGCPLLAASDHVLVTQGYGEGTHAPIAVAGALDLAVDGDGDQRADPIASDGIVILATHAGIAHVFPNSWPGGNVVRIINDTSGWGTLYAHLAAIAVSDGQRVELGTPIGRVGSTGMADGPHLHYEIWFRGENRNPSEVVGCWR